LASRIFGIGLVTLSIFVALETLCRKLFNFSFEGADELGGYVLAVGSSLAFTVALHDRAHIRIDALHARMPARLQAVADWLSAILLALFGLFVVYIGRVVIRDTIAYDSTAQSPWATPLIYPQSLWYASLCLFALAAVVRAVRATRLLIMSDTETLRTEFHPSGVLEELQDEVEDFQRR
jgi:TRAP-type C4-dicarboxylate transport system permease small subunit